MTTLDDDILEYSQTIERLKNENLALKQMLRRFNVFASPGDPGNLYNADLSQSLAEAENLFSGLFHSLQVPAFMGAIYEAEGQEPDFVFQEVNSKFAEFCRLEPIDIIGKSRNSIGVLESEDWTKAIYSACKTLDSKCVDIMDRNVLYSVSLFASSHSTFVAHFVSASEANSRKINTDLFHKLRLYKLMMDAIPAPIFCKDLDGHYMMCNRSYARDIVGAEPGDIIGTSPEAIEIVKCKEPSALNLEKYIQQIKDKGAITSTEPVKCADSATRQYSITQIFAADPMGKLSGVLGIMQDAGSIQVARKELADSEKRYKALFNSITQPIIVVDADGNIVMLNTSAVELFEEDDSSLMDNTVQVVPALKLINMEYVRQVYDTGSQISYRVPIRKAGKERWYFCTMQPIPDFFGQKVVQIISNDITDIKHYQAEILKQKQRAEESNTLKNIFLGNIAQETRFPASMICGVAQMMKAGINPEKHGEYVSMIYTNCRKLLEIIDDMVQLSQIESGQIELRHEICSINNIIEEAHLYLESMVGESGKPVEISHTPLFSDSESLIYADSLCINQAFKKLISNAVAFTETGTIELGAEVSQQSVTFYVSDTGAGMPKEKINEIFERFRQVDEDANRKYVGSGLGLPIVNELVKCMKGSISISSTVGKGSCFRFSIPYCKAEV